MTGGPSHEPLSAPPPRALTLAAAIASADLIIVGIVTRVSEAAGALSIVSREAEPAYDQLGEAEVAVVRTLAGEAATDPLRVFFLVGKVPSRPWGLLARGQTVLLFLRSTEGGYVPVAPSERPIQAVRSLSAPDAGTSRVERVTNELEQVVLTTDPVVPAREMVRAAVARASLPGNLDLRALSSPPLRDPARRAAWVAIALTEQKIAALDEVRSLFSLAAALSDGGETERPSGEALRSLVCEAVSGLRVPAARAGLAGLLHGPNGELARAAAVALRRLHDPAAAPDLLTALDHPDQGVRYQAVMGLAELEPSVDGGPAFELFRKDELRYIERWKQWWRSANNK
jgi:hypothetical protein